MSRTAWLLNLDAEEELAAPGKWQRSGRLWEATAPARERAFARLASPGDLLLEPGQRVPAGTPGQAWCPTPSALEELARAGATLPSAPPVEVLRRVNDRRFLRDLGLSLPEGRLYSSAEEHRRGTAGVEARLRHKTLLAAAGRGQRVVCPARASAADRAWLAARLASGPLWVEPELEVRVEFVVHGLVERGGGVRVGGPHRQRTTGQGHWRATEGAEELALPGRGAIEVREAAERAGQGLAAAGYFGPFGLDGLWHSSGLHPASDLNARFTMGWRVPAGGSTGSER